MLGEGNADSCIVEADMFISSVLNGHPHLDDVMRSCCCGNCDQSYVEMNWFSPGSRFVWRIMLAVAKCRANLVQISKLGNSSTSDQSLGGEKQVKVVCGEKSYST